MLVLSYGPSKKKAVSLQIASYFKHPVDFTSMLHFDFRSSVHCPSYHRYWHFRVDFKVATNFLSCVFLFWHVSLLKYRKSSVFLIPSVVFFCNTLLHFSFWGMSAFQPNDEMVETVKYICLIGKLIDQYNKWCALLECPFWESIMRMGKGVSISSYS